MAAARFVDTIFKLLGMTAEASDAVSAYTQVRNNMLFFLKKNKKGTVKERMSSGLDPTTTSSTTEHGGTVLKTARCHLKETCIGIPWLIFPETDTLKKV